MQIITEEPSNCHMKGVPDVVPQFKTYQHHPRMCLTLTVMPALVALGRVKKVHFFLIHSLVTVSRLLWEPCCEILCPEKPQFCQAGHRHQYFKHNQVQIAVLCRSSHWNPGCGTRPRRKSERDECKGEGSPTPTASPKNGWEHRNTPSCCPAPHPQCLIGQTGRLGRK